MVITLGCVRWEPPAPPSALRHTDAKRQVLGCLYKPIHRICIEPLTTRWEIWLAPNPLPCTARVGILRREAAGSNKQSPPSAQSPAPLCLPLGEASSSRALTHAHMHEQDVHHGPAPGHQLAPRRSAGAALPLSGSQSPASHHKPYPALGNEDRCNSSIMPSAQKDVPGWTMSWLWLLKAVLSPASMACPVGLQEGGSLTTGVQVPSRRVESTLPAKPPLPRARERFFRAFTVVGTCT